MMSIAMLAVVAIPVPAARSAAGQRATPARQHTDATPRPGSPPTRRSWAGTTLPERRADRRARLVATALDLLGTKGSAAVTVRAVCRGARVTERNFYEHFAGRDELLGAVHAQVAAEARAALADAVARSAPDPVARARAVVEAFVGLVIDDPRRGRIVFLEPVHDRILSARGVAELPSFAALVAEHLPATGSHPDQARALAATGLVGALSNLFRGWLDGTLAVPRAALVDHCVAVVLAHATLAAAGHAQPPAPG